MSGFAEKKNTTKKKPAVVTLIAYKDGIDPFKVSGSNLFDGVDHISCLYGTSIVLDPITSALVEVEVGLLNHGERLPIKSRFFLSVIDNKNLNMFCIEGGVLAEGILVAHDLKNSANSQKYFWYYLCCTEFFPVVVSID